MRKRAGVGILGLVVTLLLLVCGSVAFGRGGLEPTEIPFVTSPVEGPERPMKAEGIEPVMPEGSGPRSSWLDWWAQNWGAVLALGFGITLAYIVADTAGLGHPRSWWDRLVGGWIDTKVESFRDRWEDAKDWARNVAFPWLGYVAKSAGLYAEGFVFEAASGLGFGVGHIVLHLMGKNPDAIDDYYFQVGRMGGAKALEYWGYLEMLLGVTGVGAGMLASATGFGAIAGAPASAVSAGLVAAGTGHALRGNIAYRSAKEAAERTGGRPSAKRPALKLMSEEELRNLLGPNASEQTVQRLLRFQEYAAEKMGNNMANARVRNLIDKQAGIGPLIESWVKELPPTQLNRMLEMYSGRRQLLGAITEQRTALKLAKDPNNIILKVNKHTNGGGADITYLDLKQKRLVILEAKGSFSGRSVKPKLEKIVSREVFVQEAQIDELFSQGLLHKADYKLIKSRLQPREVSVVVSTGGSAAISREALKDIANALGLPQERVTWMSLD